MLFAMNKASVLSENFRKVMDKVVRSLRLFWNMDDIEMDPLFQSLAIVRGSFLLLTKLDIDLVPWFKRYDFLANSFFCQLASSTHINKIYTFGKFRLLRWCYLLHGLIALIPFSLLIVFVFSNTSSSTSVVCILGLRKEWTSLWSNASLRGCVKVLSAL